MRPRLLHGLVTAALLVSPRAYRRRFGDEIRAEIGIRMALGAGPGHIRARVVGQGLALVGIGTAAGVVAALVTTPFIESTLYGVAPQDPVTIGGVVVLFAGVAVVATYLPARRASAVDPLDALRHE